MKKYLLTQEKIWFARKRGSLTGHGKTPSLAYKNALDMRAKADDEKNRLARSRAQSEHAIGSLSDQLLQMEKNNAALKKELQDRRIEEYILTAMAYFGEPDARAALKKVGAKTNSGVSEGLKVAGEINARMRTWREKLSPYKTKDANE